MMDNKQRTNLNNNDSLLLNETDPKSFTKKRT